MRAHDMTRFLSAAFLAAVLLAGMAWSGCIEQTPLNLPTDDICGTPDPGETITLSATLTNVGSEDATTLSAALLIEHPHVTLIQGTALLDSHTAT